MGGSSNAAILKDFYVSSTIVTFGKVARAILTEDWWLKVVSKYEIVLSLWGRSYLFDLDCTRLYQQDTNFLYINACLLHVCAVAMQHRLKKVLKPAC